MKKLLEKLTKENYSRAEIISKLDGIIKGNQEHIDYIMDCENEDNQIKRLMGSDTKIVTDKIKEIGYSNKHIKIKLEKYKRQIEYHGTIIETCEVIKAMLIKS